MILRTLLLDESCDLQAFSRMNQEKYEAIICLFWASKKTMDQLVHITGGKCFSLRDVVGDSRIWEQETYQLLKAICKGGATYRKLTWRDYLADSMLLECQRLKVAFGTIDFLVDLQPKYSGSDIQVEFILSKPNGSIFKQVKSHYEEAKGISFQPYCKQDLVSVPQISRLPFPQRWWRQFQEVRITGQWQGKAWGLVEKMDKDFQIRSQWWRTHRPISEISRGVTFISSYLHHSRILHPLESLMPARVNWVVSNYYARQGALPSDQPIYWIWQFADTNKAISKVEEHNTLPLAGLPFQEAAFLGGWIPHSPTWLNWKEVFLPSLVNLTGCLESYLDKVRPRLIAVAHQHGLEGWLTMMARSQGIPVLQAMHGVMSGYFYTQTPISSDILVVPGNFWRNQWPEKERQKILVFNPPGYITKEPKQPSFDKKRLTFFSWVLEKAPFHNFSEFTDGFIHIFNKLLSKKRCEIMVRAHTRENPSYFIQRWRHLYGSLPKGLYIVKNEPLAQVLAKTDVALMFRSTVMLNCLFNRIPIIMPGWIDFDWRKVLDDIPGIYMADDFPDIENCLEEWLGQPPSISDEVVNNFVHPPGAGGDIFCAHVKDLMNRARLTQGLS